MTDTEVRALAAVLESLGISACLTAEDGQVLGANQPWRRRHPQPAVPALPPGDAPAAAARVGVLTLADGRRLVIGTPDAPAPGSAEALSPEAAAQSRFALLAEHSIDLMVAVDGDLSITYASPASRAMLGRAPEELLGHTLVELLAADDRAAFIARHFTQAARRGIGPDLFRALRADASTLWVEARVAGLPAGNGLGQYLVTLRDADRRRRAEEALAQMNADLSALAATDALTGLPNRRQFDATLNKEWYRALRDNTPLALLMVDVDRFKSLNDLFGHQTGDVILAHVGRVIRETIRRAGDMAARYGGEEFAVVLPGTAAPGALELAEAIRRAVAQADTRAIIEGGYPVSVSVGVAATVPRGNDSAAALLHAADAGLYQAKRNGRNRVEMLR